jgi:restriction system protein
MKKEYDFSGGQRGRFYRPGIELNIPVTQEETEARQNGSAKGPRFVSFFWPVIEALKKLGGSARPAEVREEIAVKLGISDAAQAETLQSGFPRFDNQVAWARFYLAKAGVIDSSSRGVWTLTEKGRSLASLTHHEALAIFKRVHVQSQLSRDVEGAAEAEEAHTAPPQNTALPISTDYRQQALEILRSLPAPGFERFCQRLLRESGFQEVTITGRSGDGGIHGLGILQVSALVSFKVLFQCKRYAGPVTPAKFAIFVARCKGALTRGSSLRREHSLLRPRRRRFETGSHPLLSWSMAKSS